VDAFCDFAGTGGSFAGCAAALKEYNPSIRCFVVEPAGAAILASQPVTNPNHRIQGGGYSMARLPLLRPEQIDGYLQVTDEAALDMARRLAKEEGVFAGSLRGPMSQRRCSCCRPAARVKPLPCCCATQG
jgi:cysteine synthase A